MKLFVDKINITKGYCLFPCKQGRGDTNLVHVLPHLPKTGHNQLVT